MFEDAPAYLIYKLVSELNRAADTILRDHLNISYNRVIFLLALYKSGTVTQHELAVALGHSDPAISTMVAELAKEGYVSIVKSPEHGRKRLVTITPQGTEIVTKGGELIYAHFDQLMQMAGVDTQHYAELTEQIYKTLITKMQNYGS